MRVLQSPPPQSRNGARDALASAGRRSTGARYATALGRTASRLRTGATICRVAGRAPECEMNVRRFMSGPLPKSPSHSRSVPSMQRHSPMTWQTDAQWRPCSSLPSYAGASWQRQRCRRRSAPAGDPSRDSFRGGIRRVKAHYPRHRQEKSASTPARPRRGLVSCTAGHDHHGYASRGRNRTVADRLAPESSVRMPVSTRPCAARLNASVQWLTGSTQK